MKEGKWLPRWTTGHGLAPPRASLSVDVDGGGLVVVNNDDDDDAYNEDKLNGSHVGHGLAPHRASLFW